MDVVYVLGTGSRWNNNEIRFSLRSIEQNLRDVGNVFIVGELPGFLQNVVHIPAKDIFDPAINADGNIITKVLTACEDERLSDDFLFINDDHLVLQETNISNVPPFHKGDMTSFEPKYWELNFWRKRLKRTMEVLSGEHYTTYHFDCHTPIIFNKHIFKEAVRRFNYADGIGYTMKSLYGNLVYKDMGVLLKNEKKTIFKNYTLSEINERLQGVRFMSFNDYGLNKSLKLWLIENFGQQSKYEKDLPADRILETYLWKKNGENYIEGVKLFTKYVKNRNLCKLFQSGESEVLRKKLAYKLNLTLNEL